MAVTENHIDTKTHYLRHYLTNILGIFVKHFKGANADDALHIGTNKAVFPGYNFKVEIDTFEKMINAMFKVCDYIHIETFDILQINSKRICHMYANEYFNFIKSRNYYDVLEKRHQQVQGIGCP